MIPKEAEKPDPLKQLRFGAATYWNYPADGANLVRLLSVRQSAAALVLRVAKGGAVGYKILGCKRALRCEMRAGGGYDRRRVSAPQVAKVGDLGSSLDHSPNLVHGCANGCRNLANASAIDRRSVALCSWGGEPNLAA